MNIWTCRVGVPSSCWGTQAGELWRRHKEQCRGAATLARARAEPYRLQGRSRRRSWSRSRSTSSTGIARGLGPRDRDPRAHGSSRRTSTTGSWRWNMRATGVTVQVGGGGILQLGGACPWRRAGDGQRKKETGTYFNQFWKYKFFCVQKCQYTTCATSFLGRREYNFMTQLCKKWQRSIFENTLSYMKHIHLHQLKYLGKLWFFFKI